MPTPIPPPNYAEPRRVNLPLPPVRYVPGIPPHPRDLPAGPGALPPNASPDTAFERGLDLLANRFPWEAHEAMEAAWLHWKNAGDPRASLAGGLIKIAAAWLRHHAGDDRAARRLLERATLQLDEAPSLGLDLTEVLRETRRFIDGGPWPRWPVTPPQP